MLALFDSILRGFPISTLLFWELEPYEREEHKAYRFVQYLKQDMGDNEPASLESSPEVQLVLDGQQRLTSLFIGLSGHLGMKTKHARKRNEAAWSDYSLYVDLLQVPNGQEDQDSDDDEGLSLSYGLKFFSADAPPNGKDSKHRWMKMGKILSCSTLEKKEEELQRILADRPPDAPADYVARVTQVFNRAYSAIFVEEAISYFVVRGLSLEQVLRIFVRANSAGTPLSKSDLLLSTIVTHWTASDPRKIIKDFVRQLNQEFSSEGRASRKIRKDLVMKASLMLSGLDPRYDVSSFTETNIGKIEDNWGQISDSLLRTVALCKGLGLSNETISSLNTLLPIAYYLSKSPEYRAERTDQDFIRFNNAAIHRWLVSSLFNHTFSGTSDRALQIATKFIDRALEDAGSNRFDFPAIALFRELKAGGRSTNLESDDVDKLLEETRYDESDYRDSMLFLSLLYEPRPWSKQSIDHIVPRVALSSKVLKDYSHDIITQIQSCEHRVGNLQLLPKRQNSGKKDKHAWEWLAGCDDSFRREQLIPSNYRELLEDLRYFPTFVAEREKLIKARLLGSLHGSGSA